VLVALLSAAGGSRLAAQTLPATGAIHGVLSMLKRLAADHGVAARACVFDAKGKTFREDAYPEYKANRPSMPEDLASQIEPLKDAIAALGWPVLTVAGVEADDVIAPLAEEARRGGWNCVISTGDKDLAQLVDERVTLVNTMSNERLDPAGVQQKFGVAPTQIVDYLALTGDAVDNVPGVEKGRAPCLGQRARQRSLAAAGHAHHYGDTYLAHAGRASPGSSTRTR
jgi:DNA polymerase-1